MATLFEAYSSSQGRTWNGAVTNTTSQSKCVDFFFNAGSMRGDNIIPMFAQALAEDEDRALRIIQWLRDIRGGAGERQLFRDALQYLEETKNKNLPKVIGKVPTIGRWDDLLVFKGKDIKEFVYAIMGLALLDKNQKALCAKWLPRKGPVALEFRKFYEMSPKTYRKMLVECTDVVETKMCAKQWDKINFSHVPSLASARYQKAFGRNAPKEYQKYIDSLVKGEKNVKVNAAAVYPYDVVKSIFAGNIQVANEQWKALPDYCKNTEERVLPVVDVSGSMYWEKINPNLKCVDVAISLGLYLSERLPGVMKDTFMTFSHRPEIWKLQGTLEQRCTALKNADWGANTDIEAVFKELLNTANRWNLSESEMPTMIIILSDMEFDRGAYNGKNVLMFDIMKERYKRAGYELPKIVFWNLKGRSGNVPVTYNKQGTALISGFSPAIMKSVLACDDMSPQAIMDKTIMQDRYKLK